MSDTTVSSGILGRTRGLLRRALRDVVESASSLTSRSGRGGEASARTNAADLGHCYLELNDTGRLRFLTLLTDEYGIEPAHLNDAMDAVRAATDDPKSYALALSKLREDLSSPRMRLLRQFNGLEYGVKFLVDMRADLRGLLRDHPELAPLDAELKYLLSGWFDAGFLELRRITWSAPADLLEKLIEYEAVHEIQSWTDLKNRLESDRRFYAFFHPSMHNEPLIFVEVALVKGIADNVQTLLPADRQCRRRRYGHLLLDLERPAGPVGREFRGFPDQAGGRSPVP